MARPPLAPARLRAPDGYVATRERSFILNTESGPTTSTFCERPLALSARIFALLLFHNVGRCWHASGFTHRSLAQREHPCFTTSVKFTCADSKKRAKIGPAVDPNSTTTAPAPAPALLLRPLLDLPHAARRLRGRSAGLDVRHVLGLRHVLLRQRAVSTIHAVDARTPSPRERRRKTQASANPSSPVEHAPRTPTAT
jgi:hypothetical protein